MQNKITRFAAAACLLFGILMWYMTIGPASITFADVQDSIASKEWVCIKFDNGAEQWANLKTKLTFYTSRGRNGKNFYAVMRDHAKGLMTFYHSNWTEQIHVRSFAPRPYPLTAWDYATEGWNSTGIPSPGKIERFEDTLDGKAVVRFDMYNLGPSGLRVLYRKVWADPKTRLPLRMQKYSSPKYLPPKRSSHIHSSPKDSLIGYFSFPDSGPSSIHYFGVSKDLKIISNFAIGEPEAIAIIDAAKRAEKNLPKEMRITTTDYQNAAYSVCYRLGNKFRDELYVLKEARTGISYSDSPKDPEQMRQWVQNNQFDLDSLRIFDGKYLYSYRAYPGVKELEANWHVEPQSTSWIDSWIPIRDQWFKRFKTALTVIDDEPTTPEGCVLLRHEGPDLKIDYYVDPKRDYICVKQLRWKKDDKTNEWIKDPSFQLQRSDLSRLPSGQWYAQTARNIYRDVQLLTDADKERTVELRKTIVHRDVQLLTDADKERIAELDKTVGFFDGEKLLKEAKAKNVKITFWAR